MQTKVYVRLSHYSEFLCFNCNFFLLHCDEWDRVVALPRHKFVTGATLLQLDERTTQPENTLYMDVACVRVEKKNIAVLFHLYFVTKKNGVNCRSAVSKNWKCEMHKLAILASCSNFFLADNFNHDIPRHRQFRRQITLQCILIGKTSWSLSGRFPWIGWKGNATGECVIYGPSRLKKLSVV
jgi:hypothetical protein